MPPYSPELNSIERVWKLTRRLCTHNQYFSLLSDLVAAGTGQLERWGKPNRASCDYAVLFTSLYLGGRLSESDKAQDSARTFSRV